MAAAALGLTFRHHLFLALCRFGMCLPWMPTPFVFFTFETSIYFCAIPDGTDPTRVGGPRRAGFLHTGLAPLWPGDGAAAHRVRAEPRQGRGVAGLLIEAVTGKGCFFFAGARSEFGDPPGVACRQSPRHPGLPRRARRRSSEPSLPTDRLSLPWATLAPGAGAAPDVRRAERGGTPCP